MPVLNLQARTILNDYAAAPFSRWFHRKPRTIRRALNGDFLSAKPRLLSLEERIAPAVTATPFVGPGTEEQYQQINLNSLSAPPNAEGAVGPNDFVENLNNLFVVYSRTPTGISATGAATVSGNDFFDPTKTFGTDALHSVYEPAFSSTR